MSKNRSLLDFFGKKSPAVISSASPNVHVSPNVKTVSPTVKRVSNGVKKSPANTIMTPKRGKIVKGVKPKRLSSPVDKSSMEDSEDKRSISKKVNTPTSQSKRRRIVIASESEDSGDEYKPQKDEMSSDSDFSDSEEPSSSASEVEEQSLSESEAEEHRRKKKHKTSRGQIHNVSVRSLPMPKKSVSNDTKNKLVAFSPAQKSRCDQPVESGSKEWAHLKLEWLKEKNRKDKKGRSVSHPEYDPRTLYIPDSFKKTLSPAMKQWWDMKSEHFDTILFFKVGKFYELYHMDAVTGVNELGLIFMKGEFSHSGFPEIAYGRYADVLVQKGYKVARIEQTETPAMMEERCRQLVRATKFDKVVQREICQITTKGTRTFTCQEGDVVSSENNYLLAVTEKTIGDFVYGESEYGVCFVDTSMGKFHVGQFTDDRHCSRMRMLTVHYPPSEILLEKDSVSKKTHQMFNSSLSSVRKESLSNCSQCWDPSNLLKSLVDGKYFSSNNDDVEWPEVLQEMLDDDDRLLQTPKKKYELAMRAVGAIIWYLIECHIDHQLLTMKVFEHYIPLDVAVLPTAKKSFAKQNMIVDGITLHNLEILSNNSSEILEGSLQEAMDFCSTSFGKRLLRQWLCAPLCHPESISDRLDAVDDLENISSVVDEAVKHLRKLPDLERLLSKIHAQGLAYPEDHPDSRAIFYEEVVYSKRKIMDFLSTLDGFKNGMKIISCFKSSVSEFRSSSLSKYVTLEEEGGCFPDLQQIIEFFDNAFVHEKARKEGRIIPSKGVDKEFDKAIEELQSTQNELDSYLEKQKKYFQSKVSYVGSGRNRFQLEVPDHVCKRASDDYELQSQRKGFKRFYTKEVRAMLLRYTSAEDQRDVALQDIMRRIFAAFDKNYKLWKSAIQCLSVLDVLLSFHQYKNSCQVAMCRPEVVLPNENNEVFIEIRSGVHPSLLKHFVGDDYIPNDICLGPVEDGSGDVSKQSRGTVLVTGPNMGGKSTLMRQTGLLIIMAQMGSYVPAVKCRLTPVDRIFTRLGARDHITAGESTFFVEVSETACILQHATRDSLVLVDELGRGTSTYDGTAIAIAVVKELALQVQCRTLFSTHYHSLVDEFMACVKVSLGHMACIVEDDDKHPALESITFLYKFIEGACPKSHGFNVAHLAGIPEEVIRLAYNKAQEFERAVESKKQFRLLHMCKSKQELKKLQELCI